MKRKLLIGIAAVTVFAFALPIFGQTGIPASSMSQCDTQMQTFLTNYQIPGATFALAKNGKLIYMRAFGTANRAATEATQPYHMFRRIHRSTIVNLNFIKELRTSPAGDYQVFLRNGDHLVLSQKYQKNLREFFG